MRDEELLDHELALPDGHGKDRVVQWHVFRTRRRAEDFMRSIRVGDGQCLVGGYTRDSVGPLWWLGVQVEDVERWGNSAAVNKRGASA